MREILFRGKAINRDVGFHTTNYKNGDWVYGLVTQLYDERFENLPAKMTNTNGIRNIEVDYKTISQCTGLTDKNGNKIFEGDILEIDFKNSKYTEPPDIHIKLFSVVFNKDNACFKKQRIINGLLYPFTKYDIYKVIGNIYDNPELLKEADSD